MKVLVIGGVAAGTKAAAKWKDRENRGDQVLVLTKSADISYAGCGLPYYVGGSIENREELIGSTPLRSTGALRAWRCAPCGRPPMWTLPPRW